MATSFVQNQESERAPDRAETAPRTLEGRIGRNEIADPTKLQQEGYSRKPFENLTDKSKAGNGQPLSLDCSADIYGNNTDSKPGKAGKAATGVDTPSLLNKSSEPGVGADININIFNNNDYANAMLNREFLQNAKGLATTALDQNRGAGTSADSSFNQKAIEAYNKGRGTHQTGEQWKENGVESMIDKDQDLITRDSKGLHFKTKDGLTFDRNEKEAVLSKDGETVIKRGDQYTKKFGNGEEVEIQNKGDIEAIVKVKDVVVQQRKDALHKLNADEMHDAAKDGTKIVTAKDGVAVYNVDKNSGAVVAKSSKEEGATIRLADGQLFKAFNGQVFSVDANGNQSPVADGELPKVIARNSADQSLQIGTVNLGANNVLHNSENDVHMNNGEAKVTANTSGGPLTAEVIDGKSTVHTPAHTFVYDSKSEKYTVFNPDNSVNLTFDNATSTLVSNGATFSPFGTEIGDHKFANPGSEHSSSESEKKAIQKAKEAETEAESELAAVTSDIGNYGATDADVALLQNEIAKLESVKGGSDLAPQVADRVNAEESLLASVLSTAAQQAQANDNTAQLTGAQNPQLTQLISNGGSLQTPDLQRYGLLPIEFYDSANAA